MISRSGRYPSVVLYCSASLPLSRSTASAAWEISRIGNDAGLGSPPPKEIMDGSCVTFNISLMKDLCTLPIRSAKFDSILS